MIHGGVKQKDFLDFSISVNPLKPSWLSELDLSQIYRYTYVEWLEEDFRKKFGDDAVLTAGASEALQIIGWELLKDATLIVPIPNYYEYFRIAEFSNSQVVQIKVFDDEFKNYDFSKVYSTAKQLRARNKKVVFITSNPNNPVGKFLDLSQLLNELILLDVLCVIDESFIDFVPKQVVEEFEKSIKFTDKLIRIRTFTKIFAVPGIRVGYVKSHSYQDVFLQRRVPWGIGGIGYSFLELLLKNDCEEFIKETVEYVQKEKSRFEKFNVVESDVNYFLLKVKNVDALLLKLANEKIAVRDARNFGIGNYVRIGLKDTLANEKLVDALTKAKEILL